MIIYLQRAFDPGEMGPAPCCVCGVEFEHGPVLARADASGWDMGEVCEACLLMFDRQAREIGAAHSWATYEEYLEATRRYPAPIFADNEEAERAEEKGLYWRHYEESFLSSHRS